MKAYSIETRKAVIRAVQEGKLTQEEIADLFGVSSRWVRIVYSRWVSTGRLEPLPHAGGYRPKITLEIAARLGEYIKQHPDAYLFEIRRDLGLSVTLSAICQALKRLNLPRKKKVMFASERDRPDVQAKRVKWKHRTCQIDANRLHFVDETGVSTRMYRPYGRAPSGERVVGSVPENHYQSITLVGSMSLDGSIQSFVYQGGTDVPAMTTYVETILAPHLAAGDIVVWDNLPTHDSAKVIEAVERTGAEVWSLPPYSPDLSPIEKLWSKVKSFLRGIGPRSKDALLSALASALKTVTPSDIRNWFINAGYRKMHA